MGKRAVTRELYEAIVQGFREAPGNYTHAGRHACVDRQTAKRAWLFGWPARSWAPPISKVIEKERIEAEARARADRQREAEAAAAVREGARQEAIEAKKQEATMLRGARGDVIAVLVLASELISPMRDLVAIVKEKLSAVDPATGKRTADFSVKEALGILDRFSRIVAKGVGAAEAVIQLSRLDRGETNLNVNVGIKPAEDMTEEDALRELAVTDAVLEGLARNGALGEEGRQIALDRTARRKTLAARVDRRSAAAGSIVPVRRRSLLDVPRPRTRAEEG